MNRRGFFSAAMAGVMSRWLGISTADAVDWIVAEIYAAADRHGASGDELLAVAQCESGLDPHAVNPVTGDSGCFQFGWPTWIEFSGYRGIEPPDIFNVWWQCDMAAWAFANGFAHRWCCHPSWAGGTCQ